LLLLGDLLDKPSRHTGHSLTRPSCRRASLFLWLVHRRGLCLLLSFVNALLCRRCRRLLLLLSTQQQIRVVHQRAPSSSRHRRSNRRVLLSFVVVPATDSPVVPATRQSNRRSSRIDPIDTLLLHGRASKLKPVFNRRSCRRLCIVLLLVNWTTNVHFVCIASTEH